MSQSLLQIIGISSALCFVTFLCIVRWRNNVTLMTGMMIAMATGMVSGILGGTILGYYFSGNLFLSTILGMLTGILIGFLMGMPLGILPVLDGVLSGLMAGMMGAMLGDMISSDNIDQLLKVLFIIYIGISFIVIYLLLSEIKEKKGHFIINSFKNPIIAAGLFIILGFILAQSDTFILAKSLPEKSVHGDHKEMGGTKKIANEANIIRVTANEFAYLPGKITMKSGETYTIELANEGDVEHDINIVENLDKSSKQGADAHSEGLFHLHANAGDKAQAEFKPEKKGQYYFYCTIPGHKEAGMVGNMEVL